MRRNRSATCTTSLVHRRQWCRPGSSDSGPLAILSPAEGSSMPLPRPAPGTGRWWVIGTIGVGIGIGLAVWLGLANSLGADHLHRHRLQGARRPQRAGRVRRPPAPGHGRDLPGRGAGHRPRCRRGRRRPGPRRPRSGRTHQVVVVRTASRAVGGNVRACDRLLAGRRGGQRRAFVRGLRRFGEMAPFRRSRCSLVLSPSGLDLPPSRTYTNVVGVRAAVRTTLSLSASAPSMGPDQGVTP